MLLEPIKELDMTYKKLLKEAKKHIRTRIIDYKPASSIHIAGINDNSQIPNAIICWLKDGSQIIYISGKTGGNMRLIDAYKINFNEVFVGASELAQDTRNAAQMLINRQPTAYDVNKVVKQLKERSKEFNSGLRLHGKPEDMRTDEAIEIVKAGVKENG